MVNGGVQVPSNRDFTLGGVISRILARNGGSLSIAGSPTGNPPSLANQVITELGTNVTREVRVQLSKESKDPGILAQLAAQHNWTLAGDDLIG